MVFLKHNQRPKLELKNASTFLMTGLVSSLGWNFSGEQFSRGKYWQSDPIVSEGYSFTISVQTFCGINWQDSFGTQTTLDLSTASQALFSTTKGQSGVTQIS